MKRGIIETIKEAARVAFLAALGAILAWGTTKVSGLDPNSVYALVATLALRLLDKFIHENGDFKARGIAPF